jgi:hypothetical protein
MEDVAGGGWLHPFVVFLSIVPPDGEAWGGGVAAAAVRRAGRQDILCFHAPADDVAPEGEGGLEGGEGLPVASGP